MMDTSASDSSSLPAQGGATHKQLEKQNAVPEPCNCDNKGTSAHCECHTKPNLSSSVHDESAAVDEQDSGPTPAAQRDGSGIDASDVRLANLRLMECIATRSKYSSAVQRLRTQAYPGTFPACFETEICLRSAFVYSPILLCRWPTAVDSNQNGVLLGVF